MPLTLRAHRRLELRWWWEGAPSGEPVVVRDPAAARRYVATLLARPGLSPMLRRFVQEGAPGQWSGPHDAELCERLANALAAGRARIAEAPAEALSSWGDVREEAPAVEPLA